MVQLSGLLAADGAVAHCRETESAESAELLAAVPHLTAVPGGSASGWRTRAKTVPPPRLLRVSVGAGVGGADGSGGSGSGGGGRLGCVTRVAALPSSLSERHAFVLDVPAADGEGGSVVYQWHGHTAPLRAKACALLLANTIRSIDRRARSEIHVVGHADPPPEGEEDAAAAEEGAGSGGASATTAPASAAEAVAAQDGTPSLDGDGAAPAGAPLPPMVTPSLSMQAHEATRELARPARE